MPEASSEVRMPQEGDAYVATIGRYKDKTVLVMECDGSDVGYADATTGAEFPVMSVEKFLQYFRPMD
jgi:hypothetical protein